MGGAEFLWSFGFGAWSLLTVLWYRFFQCLFRAYYRLYHRACARGAENMPPAGGLIVAANHLSFLDPPLVGAFAPRPIHYLARKTLFRHPLIGALLRSWSAVPLDQQRGDVRALRTALDLLASGEAVLIFPEGRRSPDGRLQQAQSGFGWLVVRSGAPVLPVRITGTFEAMPLGIKIPRPRPIKVCFGPLLRFDDLVLQARAVRGERVRTMYGQIGAAVLQKISELPPCKGQGA